VRWNRYPTALADPYDLINGVSSVLAGSALGDVGLHLLWAPAASAAWWQLLPPVVAVVVLLVCLGTACPCRRCPVWAPTPACGW
jgi:hypothetical protein